MKIFNKQNELIFNGECLQGADLQGAYLQGANLQDANLQSANLWNAVLQDANLQSANLWNAVLHGADLRNADLHGADLRNADLQGANLQDADLQGAYLQGANLQDADLWNVNLQDANLQSAILPNFKVCPPSGTFIAWKKGCGENIIKLQIPSFARRTSCLKNRKCRAEFVKVLKIYDKNDKNISKCYGKWDESFLYEVGKFMKPDSYCDDIRIDCSNGIHFFLTYDEALNW